MVQRGCGTRKENDLYACVETSPFGKPIEFFLIDPVTLWKEWRDIHQEKALRGVLFKEDSKGINHLIMAYGASSYPFVPDVVEETRTLGISKKIPRNFNPSKLTYGKSKLIFMHPRGSPQFNYQLHKDSLICPKNIEKPHDCIGSLWQLSTARNFKPFHQVEELDLSVMANDYYRQARITTPSTQYHAYYPKEHPIWKEHHYIPALFLQFPHFHFEYINKEGQCPTEIEKRITQAGFEVEVLPE